MARLLSDSKYAVRGRLMAIDASGMIGPFVILRTPPNTYDLNRPASYIDFRLLDSAGKTLTKKYNIHDELKVVINAATANLSAGTRNQATFELVPKGKAQSVTHTQRLAHGYTPINGKIIDSDGHHMVVVDAGVPIVVTLMNHKPSQTKEIKINSWVTFWPIPPTNAVILGKIS